MEDYGLALKLLRIHFKYTQREVADKVGVSHHAVSKWENGVNQPDIHTLRSICALYNITTEHFFRIAAGEPVEKVLQQKTNGETQANAEEMLPQKTQTAGAGMSSPPIVIVKWWWILLAFIAVSLLTLGIVALATGIKGDTAGANSGQESSQSASSIQDGSSTSQSGVLGGGEEQSSEEDSSEKEQSSEEKNSASSEETSEEKESSSEESEPTEYTLYFVSGYDEETWKDPITIRLGGTIRMPACVHEREDYVFKYWEHEISRQRFYEGDLFTLVHPKDVCNFIARWEPLPNPELNYAVKYVREDGTLLGEERHNFWESWTVSDSLIPYEGYTFWRWECDGKEYDGGDTFRATEGEEYTFVAKYKTNRFVVCYIDDRDESDITRLEIPYYYNGENYLQGNVLDFLWLSSPQKVKGWIIDGKEYGANEFIGNLSAVNDAYFEATAIWTTEKPTSYTLYFDTPYYGFDGSFYEGDEKGYGKKPMSVQLGERITIPECEHQRRGYKFIGWQHFHLGDGSLYQPGDSFTLEEDGEEVVFTAIWEPISYTVVYKSEFHEDTMMDFFEYGNDAPLVSSGHSSWAKDGYELIGWKINGVEYSLGEYVINLTDVDGGVVYAKAVWRKVY